MYQALFCAALFLSGSCFAAEPSEMLEATGLPEGTQVRLLAGKSGETIIDIQCESGIGQATLRRRASAWPRQLIVRMHLRGLECLKLTSGDVAIEWSIASHGDSKPSISLHTSKGQTQLALGNPYFAPVEIVSKDPKIPLQSGYFEVRLPAKMIATNPGSITLAWIDFYRS
jgi:hypothetical protein